MIRIASFPRSSSSPVLHKTVFRRYLSSHIDVRFAPISSRSDDVKVYPNFLTPEEGLTISKDVTNLMGRRRYEKGHWDAVITSYREVELPENGATSISGITKQIITRTRTFLEETCFIGKNISWLPCHAIDLKKEGVLSAHVDSVKFSGGIVSGISLESSAIMRLKPSEDGLAFDPNDSSGHIDLLLPPLSLYVLSGGARYNYSHELLPTGSKFHLMDIDDEEIKIVEVERDRRLSIIFRDTKD